MEDLIRNWEDEFKNQPLKSENERVRPGPFVLSNGLKIECCSNGHYHYNGQYFPTKQKLCAEIKKLKPREYNQNLKKEIPNQDDFIIDAGYKWLGRDDLFQATKQVGKRMESIFARYILGHKNWHKLNAQLSREADLLFGNYPMNLILYYESKFCVQLDTTNGPATMEKVALLTRELKLQFPTMRIESGIFCLSLRDAAPIKEVSPGAVSRHPEFANDEIKGLNSLMRVLERHELSDEEFVNLGRKLGERL